MMSDILEKYKLAFKNNVNSGRNYKRCEALPNTPGSDIARHLWFYGNYLDLIYIQACNALEGKEYDKMISKEDCDDTVTISSDLVEDDEGLSIPAIDYKEIVSEWINFSKTPPLKGQEMPYRSDVLDKYGLAFTDKIVQNNPNYQSNDTFIAYDIAQHLIYTHENEYNRVFNEKKFDVVEPGSVIKIDNNVSIPAEDYRLILPEWVGFIKTHPYFFVRSLIPAILIKYNIRFSARYVDGILTCTAHSPNATVLLTVCQFLNEFKNAGKINKFILLYYLRLPFTIQREFTSGTIAMSEFDVAIESLGKDNSKVKYILPRKDFKKILVEWKKYLKNPHQYFKSLH